MPEPHLRPDEANEVLEIAADLDRAPEPDALTRAELHDVAREVGIRPDAVDRAVDVVRARKERARARRAALLTGAVALVFGLLALAFVLRPRPRDTPAPATPGPASIAGLSVTLDLGRGEARSLAPDALSGRGAQVRTLDAAVPLSGALAGTAVYVALHPRAAPYAPADLDALESFVRGGGGLVVADLGWSWTTYERRPLADLPAQALGARLGFSFGDQATAGPRPVGPLGSLGPLVQRDWVADRLTLPSQAEPWVVGHGGGTLGGAYSLDQGRVAVFGHPDLLAQNPDVLAHAIAWASGR